MPDPLPTRLTEVGRPNQFYVRENDNQPLFGPLDYNSMDAYARHESATNSSKIAQVVVLFGSRTGDPRISPLMEMVKYVYINGRRLGGSRIGLAGRLRPYFPLYALITEVAEDWITTEDEDILRTEGMLTPNFVTVMTTETGLNLLLAENGIDVLAIT